MNERCCRLQRGSRPLCLLLQAGWLPWTCFDPYLMTGQRSSLWLFFYVDARRLAVSVSLRAACPRGGILRVGSVASICPSRGHALSLMPESAGVGPAIPLDITRPATK